MKLTVLGKYGPYPKAGAACSSYLVSCGDTQILLDAGSGSLSALQRHSDFRSLNAVIVSHLHGDHMADLLIMRYALHFAKCARLPLYLPKTPENIYNLLAEAPQYKTNIIENKMNAQVQDVAISFERMTHSVESFAVKIRYKEKILVYSGDTSQNGTLSEFAEGAHLLICDAQFCSQTIFAGAPHMSAAQAASAAAKAGAHKLLLTHIHPDQDESLLLSEAKEIFAHTLVAQENAQYIL